MSENKLKIYKSRFTNLIDFIDQESELKYFVGETPTDSLKKIYVKYMYKDNFVIAIFDYIDTALAFFPEMIGYKNGEVDFMTTAEELPTIMFTNVGRYKKVSVRDFYDMANDFIEFKDKPLYAYLKDTDEYLFRYYPIYTHKKHVCGEFVKFKTLDEAAKFFETDESTKSQMMLFYKVENDILAEQI